MHRPDQDDRVVGVSVVRRVGLRLFACILVLHFLVPSTAFAVGIVATIPVGIAPNGVAVDPTSNIVYVANTFNNSLSVIDGATNTVSTTIPVGIGPRGVAANAVTNVIYVANGGDNTVSVIDGATNSVTTVIPVTSPPSGVAVDTSTNRIYVTGSWRNVVSAIDGDTNGVIATIRVGRTPSAVAADEAMNRIYVTNANDNNVSVIDETTNAVIATVAVGSDPVGAAVDQATNRVYISNSNSSTASVIDAATNTVIATVPISPGTFPVGVAADPTTNRVYVAETGSSGDSVAVIDGSSNVLIATVPAPIGEPSFPAGVAVDPTTHRVYAALLHSAAVSVIDGTSASLVGDPNVEASSDGVPAGQAEAFPFVATASGTLSNLGLYLDASNTSNQIAVAIYKNTSSNHPGTLVSGATSVTTLPLNGQWASVPLKKLVRVVAGNTYWIVILSTNGTLRFRDTPGGGTAELSQQLTRTTLPQTWTTGPIVNAAPASAFGSP